MANIKSNEKRRRQDDKRYMRNKSQKSKIKTAIKKAEKERTPEAINEATKLIDQAVSSNVFHKNKSARLVSKIQKIIPINKEN